MEKPNELVQMDILGPFYLENSALRRIILSVANMTDCSRKTVSIWSERKRS